MGGDLVFYAQRGASGEMTDFRRLIDVITRLFFSIIFKIVSSPRFYKIMKYVSPISE